MKRKILGVLTVFAAMLAVLVGVPGTANAAPNQQVCNYSAGIAIGSVRTISSSGTKLNLSAGRCSATNVFGWRPLAGTFAYAVDATGRSFIVDYRGDSVYAGTLQGPIRVYGVYRA